MAYHMGISLGIHDSAEHALQFGVELRENWYRPKLEQVLLVSVCFDRRKSA